MNLGDLIRAKIAFKETLSDSHVDAWVDHNLSLEDEVEYTGDLDADYPDYNQSRF